MIYRATFQLTRLFLYTAAFASLGLYNYANELRLQPNLVRADATNRFIAQFSVAQNPAELPSTYYKVETSTNLQDWEPHYFRFNEHTKRISQADFSTLRVKRVTEVASSLDIEIALEPGPATFLKVTQMAEPPAEQRFLTYETHNLLQSLHRLADDPDRFVFGQEFPLTYSVTGDSGNNDIENSDCKDVVGDHPGVHGLDFHYMIDKPWEEEYHIAAAIKAYEDGAVVTFDWHWTSKYASGSQGYAPNAEANQILDYVVRNDNSRGDVDWFYEQIDLVLEYINEDMKIPFVFRPFHEMDGNWFWWGRQIQGGSETYRAAYRLLVDYMTERSDYILFCWSPDVALQDFEQFYPGDEYVDICGRDIYRFGSPSRPVSLLTEMIDFAEARGKVAVFSETGYTPGGVSFEVGDPDWWTSQVLEPIKADEKAGRIAWVLTWINASWSGPYAPHANSPQAAKDDFTLFYDAPEVLFQSEVADLNVYEQTP